MRMNAGLILAGQQPDIMGNMLRGYQGGRQRRVDNTIAQHGAGAIQGNQNALNALAGVDPQLAQGMQQGRLQMDATRQRMRLLDAQEQRAIQDQLMRMDEAQRARVKAQFDANLMEAATAYSQGNLQGVNASLAAAGMQPVASLEEALPFLMRGQETSQFLKRFTDFTAEPADEYGRYVQEELAAGRQPLSRIDYRRAGQKTTRLTTDGNGNVTLTEGFGDSGQAPDLTVEAGKNTGFYIRMQDANEVLNSLEDQGTRFGQQNLEHVPLGIGNYFRDADFQKFDQARRDFVNALLRRESGAVISPSEFDNADQQYFPVPGDTPEVIAQKRKNRENAIRGIRIGSGEGADFVDRQDAAAEPAAQGEVMTFEQFSQQQSAIDAAAKYGVTLEEMWAIKQGN